MSWRIHTGPFPFIVREFEGDLWLWRITDGEHHTSVIVTLADAVTAEARDHLPPTTRKAVETRGESAVKDCLSWTEPPREISFRTPADEPHYWGGIR